MTLSYLRAPSLARVLLPVVLCALHVAAAATPGEAAASAPSNGAGETDQVLVITGTDPYLPAFVAVDAAMRSATVAAPPARRRVDARVDRHGPVRRCAGADAGRTAGEEVRGRSHRRARAGDRACGRLLPSSPQPPLAGRAGDLSTPLLPRSRTGCRRPPGCSGVPADVDVAGALRIALSLQPAARRLVIVSGVSPFDADAAGRSPARRRRCRPTASASTTWSGCRRARRPSVWPARRPTPSCSTSACSAMRAETSTCRGTCSRHSAPPVARRSTASSSRTWVTDSRRVRSSRSASAASASAGLLARALDGSLGYGAVVQRAPRRPAVGGRPSARAFRPGARRRCRRAARSVTSRRTSCSATGGRSLRPRWRFVGQSILIAALLLQRRRRRAAELEPAGPARATAARLAARGGRRADGVDRARDQPAARRDPQQRRCRRADARVGRRPAQELREILADIRRDDLRASEVIRRLRALLAEARGRAAAVRPERRRARDRGRCCAPRRAAAASRSRRPAGAAAPTIAAATAIQIQQVLINLVLNAMDASRRLPDGAARGRASCVADAATASTCACATAAPGIAPRDLPQALRLLLHHQAQRHGARPVDRAHASSRRTAARIRRRDLARRRARCSTSCCPLRRRRGAAQPRETRHEHRRR